MMQFELQGNKTTFVLSDYDKKFAENMIRELQNRDIKAGILHYATSHNRTFYFHVWQQIGLGSLLAPKLKFRLTEVQSSTGSILNQHTYDVHFKKEERS